MNANGRLSEVVFQLEQILERYRGMHPTVRKAIDHMLARDKCCRNATFLACAVGCSQRTLRERFKEHVALPPMTFKRRLALVDSLRRLVVNPYASLDEIAQQVGYRRAGSLATMWENAVNLTPAKVALALKELRNGGRIGSHDDDEERALSEIALEIEVHLEEG